MQVDLLFTLGFYLHRYVSKPSQPLAECGGEEKQLAGFDKNTS